MKNIIKSILKKLNLPVDGDVVLHISKYWINIDYRVFYILLGIIVFIISLIIVLIYLKYRS